MFNTSVESIGDRDCKIQRVSALKGCVCACMSVHVCVCIHECGAVYTCEHTVMTYTCNVFQYREGVTEGIEWLAHRVQQNLSRSGRNTT